MKLNQSTPQKAKTTTPAKSNIQRLRDLSKLAHLFRLSAYTADNPLFPQASSINKKIIKLS